MNDSTTKNSDAEASNQPSMIEKVTDKLPTLSKAQKAAAGIGFAAAAAVASVAIRQSRKKQSKVIEIERVYHLEPDDSAWKLTLEGSTGAQASFATKEEGLTAARALASDNPPSELVIHLSDGSEQTRHRYTS